MMTSPLKMRSRRSASSKVGSICTVAIARTASAVVENVRAARSGSLRASRWGAPVLTPWSRDAPLGGESYRVDHLFSEATAHLAQQLIPGVTRSAANSLLDHHEELTVGFPSFERSAALQQRLHDLVPGGAHTFARGADQFPEGMAPVIVEGRGARVLDA